MIRPAAFFFGPQPALLAIAMLLCRSLSAPAQPAADEMAKVRAALSQSALRPGDSAVLAIVTDISQGFHAQSNTPTDPNFIKFSFKPSADPRLIIGEPIYPKGETHDFGALGVLNVYEGRVVVYVPIRVKPDSGTGSVRVGGVLTYQVCDNTMCYAPESPELAFDTKIIPATAAVETVEAELFKGFDPAVFATLDAPSRAATPPVAGAKLPGGDWNAGTAFGAAIVAGLLFNVMPCVLPVLPLKAIGFFEASKQRRSRSMALGLSFSAGLITVFAILAIVVLGLRMITWGELFSRGWFIWSVVALLVFLALGQFGAWSVVLPNSLYSIEPRHDTIGGNFAYGIMTAILATPCTAPLLPPLLFWASNQPAGVGVPAVILVGVGMSLPYLLLSGVPELAQKFPRTGPVSELFKQMMGFLLLASAVYFGAGRLVHGPSFWWLVVAVIAVAALFLVARTTQITRGALGLAVSCTIAVVMLGGSLWWTVSVTGLAATGTNPSTGGGDASRTVDHWTPFSEEALSSARAAGQPVLVKFTANWCATCQVIEGTVYSQSSTWDELSARGLVTLKADLGETDAPGWPMLRRLNPAGGIPLTAIWPAKSDQPIVIGSIYTQTELFDAVKDIPRIEDRSTKSAKR